MGKLINMFSAFFGLGLAAGAAFYIYRTRKCSGEENENTEESVLPVSEITRQSHKQFDSTFCNCGQELENVSSKSR